jgi:hypothetical protein
MKRSPFHKLIVTYYLKPLSAKAVAEEINKTLKIAPDAGTRCTTEIVLAGWNIEWQQQEPWQALERQAGPRPLHGYPPSPMIELCEQLTVAQGMAA